MTPELKSEGQQFGGTRHYSSDSDSRQGIMDDVAAFKIKVLSDQSKCEIRAELSINT